MNIKSLKYLFVHQGWSDYAIEWHQNIVKRHRSRGFDVVPFCAAPNPPSPRYTFQELDTLWRRRDKKVVALHDNLVKIASDCDVLINFNGANIHPEWLKDIPTFNVSICWDDPESSSHLSQPVAKYFDFAFTGNAACVPLYQSWGIKRCNFLPHACYENEYDPSMTVERILGGERDIDIIFLGERESSWRRSRLDQLQSAFPQAFMRGRGWPDGFLPMEEKIPTYTRAKIGWNLHNSVGPVNIRTFALPANGIMQICDNKCRLGQIFKLDKEVVGFDTIEECIELTQYYLDNDQERREISACGFERVVRDYTEENQWERLLTTIEPYIVLKNTGKLNTPAYQDSSADKVSDQSFVFSGMKHIIRKCLQRMDLEIKRKTLTQATHPQQDVADIPYVENQEVGPVNWIEKESRVAAAGFLEWPNMVALNWTVATLVGPSHRIVELGGGTGSFAYEAEADPKRFILCSDLDMKAINWARENRSRPNIQYITLPPSVDDGPFDLLVAIDVIEHITDYRSFLKTCVDLAPKSIITTPNKNRDKRSAEASPPQYYQHVREWTAGEFYWVLKMFYSDVKLYAMPNVYVPECVPINITSRMTPLIAVCE